MSDKFLRVYNYLNANQIKENCLVYGEISGNCAKCQTIDLKLHMTKCPECGTDFKYIAFRNVKSHMPKMHRLSQEREVIFIDYNDFHKALSASKAEELLG